MSQKRILTSTPSSEIYEQFMVPAMFARWAEILLELVDPQPGERVLDLACGTGIVARMGAKSAKLGQALTDFMRKKISAEEYQQIREQIEAEYTESLEDRGPAVAKGSDLRKYFRG